MAPSLDRNESIHNSIYHWSTTLQTIKLAPVTLEYMFKRQYTKAPIQYKDVLLV